MGSNSDIIVIWSLVVVLCGLRVHGLGITARQEAPNENKGALVGVLVLVDTKKVFAFPIRYSDPPRFRGANATERSGRLKASTTVNASTRNRMLVMVNTVTTWNL
jgi:hypothetical protein